MDPKFSFSQGQRQDFALSIFLARARGLGGTFFLDEPLAHLDDLNRVALLDVFRAIGLENDQSLGFVLTTASRSTARHFAEKFMRVRPGGFGQYGDGKLLSLVELRGNPRVGVDVIYDGANS